MDKKDREIVEQLTDLIDRLIKGNTQDVEEEVGLSDSPEINSLREKILRARDQYKEAFHYIMNLSHGNLDIEGPRHNTFTSHYKQLQSELLHLKWLINEVAEGNYNQQIFFAGDLSKAFNKMTSALQERQELQKQLRETTEQLQALNKMKDRFFSIIAHDLINPFNALVGYSSLLMESTQDCCKKEIRDMISIMQQSAKQGHDLLINMLEWSRQESGRITITPQMLFLEDVIQENIETIRLSALAKQITLQAYGAEGIQIYTDRNILNTIIRNLLNNAIKYSFEESEISIHVVPKESYIQLSIKDTGIGISEEDLQKLFKADLIHSTKGTKNEKGTGLGLLLCQEFVNMLQGEIWVDSAPNAGSTFSFTLPLSSEKEAL